MTWEIVYEKNTFIEEIKEVIDSEFNFLHIWNYKINNNILMNFKKIKIGLFFSNRFVNKNKKIKNIPENLFNNINNIYKLFINVTLSTTIPLSICKLNNLQELNLSENLFDVLPDCIGELKELKKLKIDHNKLTILPDSIGELKELEFLDISGNDFKIFPKCICKLINLTYLNITYCRISFLPSLKNLTKLDNFIVTQNYFKIFPESICELKNLTILQMYYCDLTYIPFSITKLKKLKMLNITHNLFNKFPNTILDLYPNLETFIYRTFSSQKVRTKYVLIFRLFFIICKNVNKFKITYKILLNLLTF